MYINSQGTNDIRRSLLPPQAAENLFFFFCVWTLFFAPAPLFSLERESEFCCIYLASIIIWPPQAEFFCILDAFLYQKHVPECNLEAFSA